MYTEQQINELAKYLAAHGYTDGVDVNPEISLGEYGILRNPKTTHVVYAIQLDSGWYVLDWSRVSLDEVKDEAGTIPAGFFSFIGTPKAEFMARLNNDCLSDDISSMNQYSGIFDQSCNWDATIETVKAQADGQN